ncbi:hypothetical protein BD31_I0476 [Candidatus Nitrosopumilus salaria BD31]|uniref:Uncharacterized protein n=1 Tax=Candidatus Nitrosopumilus salarius BD31 TaxID=859350 RepID=I3D5D2_9ARCH|nr:hypothetical protein BD31_I0476 [Candidatus Nitrosopumilus salaria BD31]
MPDNSWVEPLRKMGIAKNKICVTGSPFWDKLFYKTKEFRPKKLILKKYPF